MNFKLKEINKTKNYINTISKFENNNKELTELKYGVECYGNDHGEHDNDTTIGDTSYLYEGIRRYIWSMHQDLCLIEKMHTNTAMSFIVNFFINNKNFQARMKESLNEIPSDKKLHGYDLTITITSDNENLKKHLAKSSIRLNTKDSSQKFEKIKEEISDYFNHLVEIEDSKITIANETHDTVINVEANQEPAFTLHNLNSFDTLTIELPSGDNTNQSNKGSPLTLSFTEE